MRVLPLLLSMLGSLSSGLYAADHAGHGDQQFDPLKGINSDGSIPAIQRPDDIPYPDRWRYIPAGRIIPGSVLDRFFATSFVVPIFFFEEDVGAGGGVGFTDIDFRGQQRQEFLGAWASITSEGQQNYRMVWSRALAHRELDQGGVIFEERSHIRAEIGWIKPLTTRFFGLGSRSHESDETSYAKAESIAAIAVTHGVPHAGSDLLATAALRIEHHNLSTGKVRNRPSTDTVYPLLTQAADDHALIWSRLALEYDRRDSQHQPYRGYHIGLQVDVAPMQSDNEQGARSKLFASYALPVWSPFHDGGSAGEENPPTDSINIGAFISTTHGDLPFYSLPNLGGNDTLRGFIQNRFTDRSAWHATIEWRAWPIARGAALTDTIRFERFGFALFYDIGTVAPHLNKLKDARIHDSYGIGLRTAFERTAVFRIDYGISDEDQVVTANFGLSF